MDSEIIKRSAVLFDVSLSRLKPLSGGHFSQVYGFSRDGGDCILRITPPSQELDLPSMRSILDWMCFLSNHGTPVAAPIPSVQGSLIEAFEVDGQGYVVTAFERAKGILAEKLPIDQWDEVLFNSLGRVVGRMHALAKIYQTPPDLLKRPEWEDEDNCYHCNQAFSSNLFIQEKREQTRQAVQALPKGPDAYGLIHGDLHGANFFVDVKQRRITLFDFDDCCYGWFAMDVAMSLFDFLVLYNGPDPADFARRLLESYLSGYLRENHLDVVWISRLPLFLKLLEVEIFAMLAPYVPEQADTWGDRFLAGRVKRIEQDIPYVDVDFGGIYSSVMANERSMPR
jgi:Ser/Thr protein kinase RdoA (MazF antagonist)